MTDQATSEKPPAKERKPSRLRYEIRLDSTNDDRDSQGNVVQAPHSDTIVFDTQLDISGHATEHMERKDPEPEFTEPPLSPKSRVTLERFAATKKTTIPETDTILFKTFSKELVEPGSKLALLSQTFSYGRAIRTTNPTNTKIGPVEPQPTAHTASPSSTNEERSNRKAHESIAPGATANRESQETPADTRDGLNITSDGDLTSSMPLPQTLTTDDHLKQPIHPSFTHSKNTTPFPLPAQTSFKGKSEKKKSDISRKHRKNTKTLPTQRNAGLWPPRWNDALDDTQTLTDVSGTLLSDSIDVFHPIKPEKRDDQPKDLARNDTMLSVGSHDSSKPARGYQVHKLGSQKNIKAEHEADAYSTAEETPRKISTDFLHTLGLPLATTSSLPPAPVVTKQGSATNLAQQTLQEGQDGTSKYHHERTASSQKTRSPSLESHNDTLPYSGRSGHNLHKSQPLSCMDETTQPLNTVEPVTSQEALHRTSNRGAPSRIVKPRMKSRTESKPTSHGAQEASIPPVVGRALKSLETAFLAESFRKTHEHTTELEHAAEKVTLHLQTIDSQKEVIADLRKQRDELKVAFESLTRKAKTNQKFLEGFQKDYEKLKKLTTTAQEDNRKTLEAKIAEIEEEKHILGRELEITACKLAESQRKIRAVADELYVKLAITLSANESLTKRRDELEEAYKSEKKKREDAESELLNGIQNLQFQLSNTTNALVNKLDQFQTSVEKTAICDHQDTKIKDCLEILNSLKTEPRLKVHDVRKAEGMLCFMRTRIESGLEELHKAITRNGPHNAEDHASINEQLQDLRTNMMKYEELATENCKIKESNTALTKQLKAQRQQYAHLYEKVEHLKKVEIDLKHRSSKLEHDLGSMRNAAQSSRLEMSAIEQTNRELTQRFKEVESELVAAKAKADDAEESRKNLEKQAAEYKKRHETMAKEKMVEMQNAATAREKLSGEFELKLSEKQQELQSETNRLRAALQAEEAAHQKSNKDLRIANARIEELRKNANGQEAANNKLKAQISQQQSLMKVMSQEADERASRKQQEARSIAELARDKVSLLENETQTLLSELSKARENEHRMKRVEEALSAEKDRLHQEVRDMHSAIDTKDMEMAQIRTEFVNEHQQAIEQYRNDVEECKRRLAETTTSLKEAEANTKLLEDHYQAKISADQQLAESKLLELETEYHNVLQLVKEQSSPLEWHGPHNKASNPCLSHTGQKLSSTKGRKRVERDNRSIIETSQEQDHRRELSILSHTEGSQAQSEDQDLFALFIGDIDSSIQGQANGDLTANHGCNSIPTSQNLGASPFAQASLKERLVRTATKEPQRQIRSSSGFSSMASDELARIQKELEPDMTSRLHSRNAGSQRLEKPFDDNKPEFSHTDNASVMSSQSYQSQERPKSQANTSFRMFPPHGSAPKQNQSPSQSQVIQTKLPSKHEKLDSMIHNLGDSVSSGKRKLSITQTDSDLVPKRQHGTPSTQPAFSSSGPRRRSPRLSRASGDSSGSQSGRSNYTSSDKAHLSHHQLLQTYATPPKRHSSRVKRNQSRNGTASEDEFNDRFDEELAGLH